MKKSLKSIKIEKIVNGGLGLGRLEDGRVVLAGMTLPDEEVHVTITADKKHYLSAGLEAIVKPHPARIPPPCRWYGACGGCDLQHCGYELQLQIKQAILRDLFLRGFADTPNEILSQLRDILPSPAQFGYRQRIRLQADSNGRLGFLGFHSHRIIPIGSCLVAKDELNTVLAGLQGNHGCAGILKHCREVELLFNPSSSRVVCLFHLTRRPRPGDIRQASELADVIPLIERIFFRGADFPLTGPFGGDANAVSNSLQMVLPPQEPGDIPLALGWEAGGFCQVNLHQNIQLIGHVLQNCGIRNDDSVLDLFCGMGNFSIPIARRAASVLGIEGQGSAIRSARENSTRAGLGNTTFEKGPIHDICRRLVQDGRIFDCVVLDPPRQGVPGLTAELTALTRRGLVYISCGPATLVRDLVALTRHGLAIRHIQPLDMFPQTHHIETLVLLEKN